MWGLTSEGLFSHWLCQPWRFHFNCPPAVLPVFTRTIISAGVDVAAPRAVLLVLFARSTCILGQCFLFTSVLPVLVHDSFVVCMLLVYSKTLGVMLVRTGVGGLSHAYCLFITVATFRSCDFRMNLLLGQAVNQVMVVVLHVER